MESVAFFPYIFHFLLMSGLLVRESLVREAQQVENAVWMSRVVSSFVFFLQLGGTGRARGCDYSQRTSIQRNFFPSDLYDPTLYPLLHTSQQ